MIASDKKRPIELYCDGGSGLLISSDKNNPDYALITPDSFYNFPVETDLKKINGNLYFAGGEDEYFETEKLEIYGILLKR